MESYTIRSVLNGQPHITMENKPETILSPIAFGRIQTSLGEDKKIKTIKVLFDSGASETIVNSKLTNSLRKKQTTQASQWNTAAGTVTTNHKAQIRFTLPEFYENTIIKHNAHVLTSDINYDLIIGRDLLRLLGIQLDFINQEIRWGEANIPMKHPECTLKDFHIAEPESTSEAFKRIKSILDAKYEKADLTEVVANCKHLSEKEQKQLLSLLTKYEDLFDGTLGKWSGEEHQIQLKEGVEPYHAKGFPIPKCHEATLKLEIERLEKLGVIRKVNNSEWAAPTFIIPKKDGTVRFLSDFRELNKRIRRKPFPLPNIQDLLLKLEGFTYGTTLDLNMGYYHIRLDPDARKLCTIILPWGKYEYLRLPMGLSNAPDIFQEKISNLMCDLEFVRAYIDDLLIISKGDWDEHLNKLEQVFERLRSAGLKVNAKKCSFGTDKLEYLGYLISKQGIQPIPKKIQGILDIDVPKNRKQLRRFVGMINYYRDMWIRRSELLAPLTDLCGKTSKKFEWNDKCQKSFDLIKKLLSKEVLLAYPDFNKTFEIHTDASDLQLGAVISQEGKPIAFYSRKLTPAQTRYTTTEQELLAIVETLKEFRNILLGQKIKIYTDHLNLTHKNFTTNRVMRWRLLIEEYGPEFCYIKGTKNVVADALSRLDMIPRSATSDLLLTNADLFGESKQDIPNIINPVSFQLIFKYQKEDKELLKLAKGNNYSIQNFHGGGKTIPLIVYNGKIVIPKILTKRIVQWYHVNLCHPGKTRTEQTIRQYFTWNNLRENVHQVCSTCDICQRTKRNSKKYGKLPAKIAESNPWEKLCVDMIGPYTIKDKNGKVHILHCVTMIDPATGWFEMKDVKEKDAATVANLVEQVWLTRYPWPQEIIYDRGSEFMGLFATMVSEDYNIKKRPITVRNPQANAILERIHQTLGNIIRTFELHTNSEDIEESWNGVLSAAMFALRSTIHTTLQATPMQLVFGRDAILNIKFQADWNIIKQRKQQLIYLNNKRENSKRLEHTYNVNDKVLLDVKDTTKAKYAKNPYKGPYHIVQVNDNGTVHLDMGHLIEVVNIRNIKPYKE